MASSPSASRSLRRASRLAEVDAVAGCLRVLEPRLVVGPRGGGPLRPERPVDHRRRCRELGHAAEHRQRRLVDAAELAGIGVDVDERLRRDRRGGQRVALRLDLGQPRADRHQQVAVADPLRELRADADPDVAGVARAQVVDDVLAPEGRADRQPAALRPAGERLGRAPVPRPAADEHERPVRRLEQRAQLLERLGRRRRPHGAVARGVVDLDLSGQDVLRQRQHHGSGAPAAGLRIRAREHLGDALGVVELERPLRHRAEHGLVVELLERLAPALVARDLADEHDQRRRVLARGVDAGRRVRRARPAGDEAQPGAAGELAVGVGGVGRGAFVPAVDDAERVAMRVEPVEQSEVGLAGHAERQVGAVRHQRVRQHLSPRPHVSDPTGGRRYRSWWRGDPEA